MGFDCYPCLYDPHAKHSLFAVCLVEPEGWHYKQGRGIASLSNEEDGRFVSLARVGSMYLFEDARYGRAVVNRAEALYANPAIQGAQATEEIEV